MKLILTQEVDGLGAPGDVVEVKDGYGRNYLVPRGLAMRWTRGGEKTIDSIKKARASRAVRDQDHAEQIKTKLEAQPVPVRPVVCSAPSPRPRSPTRSPTSRARRSTAARSSWRTRSSRSAPTRCRSSCTTRCPPRWPSTSFRPDRRLTHHTTARCLYGGGGPFVIPAPG